MRKMPDSAKAAEKKYSNRKRDGTSILEPPSFSFLWYNLPKNIEITGVEYENKRLDEYGIWH